MPHFDDDAHIEEFVREKQMQKRDSWPIRVGNNDGETSLAIMYVNSDDDRVPDFLSAGHRIAIDTCLEFVKCLSVWQENIETQKRNKNDMVFKRDSHVPLLIDHADKMTRRAIIELDKNELLFK